MLGDLAAGAALVIAEGRESGTVGLFDATAPCTPSWWRRSCTPSGARS